MGIWAFEFVQAIGVPGASGGKASGLLLHLWFTSGSPPPVSPFLICVIMNEISAHHCAKYFAEGAMTYRAMHSSNSTVTPGPESPLFHLN